MIDEVAEAKRYLEGGGLEDEANHYRACYMIAKYLKQQQFTKREAFQRLTVWAQDNDIDPVFSMINCITAAYNSDNELRCGTTVKVSQDDVATIRMYTASKLDRRVALALLCCAKAMAGEDGSFVASTCAMASWLGMDAANLRGRNLKRLIEYGYVEKLPNGDADHGWHKNYFRHACRLKLLVPYSKGGRLELKYNDIKSLYEKAFGETF